MCTYEHLQPHRSHKALTWTHSQRPHPVPVFCHTSINARFIHMYYMDNLHKLDTASLAITWTQESTWDHSATLLKPTGTWANSVRSCSHDRNGEELETGVSPQLNPKNCKLYRVHFHSSNQEKEKGRRAQSDSGQGVKYSYNQGVDTENQPIGGFQGCSKVITSHSGTNQDRGRREKSHMVQWGVMD